jgi:hypothetical protein
MSVSQFVTLLITRPDFWLWVLEFGSKTKIGNFLFLKNWTQNQTKPELEQNKIGTGELTRVYLPRIRSDFQN